jgi:hypothetical protein
MKKLASIVAILAFPAFLFAQQPVTGLLRDAITQKPIEGANIQRNNNPATASGKAGRFILDPGVPVLLKVSHIGYYTKEILISQLPEDSLIIDLIPRIRNLEEVVITGKPYFQFFKPRSFYVQDYAIQDNRVWALGFEDKNILKPELRLLNLSGKTLDKIRINQKSGLFQDPSGTVHLFNPDSIFQLFYDRRQITFLYPNPLDESAETLFNLQVMRGDTVIFRMFNRQRSYCEFIAANLDTGKHDTIFASFNRSVFKSNLAAENYSPGPIPLCEIYPATFNKPAWGFPSDLRWEYPAGTSDKDIMVAEGRKLPEKGSKDDGFEPTRASRKGFTDYAFKRTIVNKPVSASMFYSHNLYYIFEGTNLIIWRLKPDFSISNSLNVILNKDAREIRMIQDPVDQFLYLSYQINGSCYVSKIDPASGLISRTKQIPGFPFAEKIKIFGGRIYFIYQSTTGQNSTNLYSINID